MSDPKKIYETYELIAEYLVKEELITAAEYVRFLEVIRNGGSS